MKVRIHGDIETPLCMAETLTSPWPFCFDTDCVTRLNDNGDEYSKYVVFDFEVTVKDMEEAENLKTFLDAFQGMSDGSFDVDIIPEPGDPPPLTDEQKSYAEEIQRNHLKSLERWK